MTAPWAVNYHKGLYIPDEDEPEESEINPEDRQTWIPSIFRKKRSKHVEIQVHPDDFANSESTIVFPDPPEKISLWVDDIVNHTTQLDSLRWNVRQLIGPPKVYPKYGHHEGAWAQGRLNSRQCVVVQFAEPLYVHQVDIYETYMAGGVKAVCLWNSDKNEWVPIWDAETDTLEIIEESRLFSPPIDQLLDFATDIVLLEVNCLKASSYRDIDAIRMKGYREFFDPAQFEKTIEELQERLRLRELETQLAVNEDLEQLLASDMNNTVTDVKNSSTEPDSVEDEGFISEQNHRFQNKNSDNSSVETTLNAIMVEESIEKLQNEAIQLDDTGCFKPIIDIHRRRSLGIHPSIVGATEINIFQFTHDANKGEESRSSAMLHDIIYKPEIEKAQALLPIAVSDHNTRAIEWSLKYGANPNFADKYGNTIMHMATMKGDLDVLELLYLYGGDIEFENNVNWQMVHVAAMYRQSSVLEWLIEKGVPLDCKTNMGNTPLHCAAISGCENSARILIENGIEINSFNNMDKKPIEYAFETCHIQLITLMLTIDDMYKLARDRREFLIKEMSGNGVNVTEIMDKHQRNSLHRAVIGLDLIAIKLLLKHETAVNECDDENRSPIFSAVINGSLEVVMELYEHGAIIACTDKHGWSLIRHAVDQGHLNILEWLYEKGVDIYELDEEDRTLTYYAAVKGHQEILEWLNDHDVDLSWRDKGKRNICFIAVENNRVELLKWLHSKDVDIHVLDENGNNLCHMAAALGFYEILDWLIENRLDTTLLNKDARTPQQLAKERNHESCNTLLLACDKSKAISQRATTMDVYNAAKDGKDRYLQTLCDDNLINIRDKDSNDETALHKAIRDDEIHCMNTLFRFGANMTSLNTAGETPLYVGVKYGKSKTLQDLTYSRDPEILKAFYEKLPEGQSLLHIAALNERVECMELLMNFYEIKSNGDRNIGIFNNKLETPLDIARQNDSREIVDVIVRFMNKQLPHIIRRRGFIGGGEIKFTLENGKVKTSKFMKIKPNTPAVDLRILLRWYWGMSLPGLVIALEGGIQEKDSINPELKKIFGFAISKAVGSMNALLMTNDNDDRGFIQFIGESMEGSAEFDSDQSMIIGYANWKPRSVTDDKETSKEEILMTYEEPDFPIKLSPIFNYFVFIDNGENVEEIENDNEDGLNIDPTSAASAFDDRSRIGAGSTIGGPTQLRKDNMVDGPGRSRIGTSTISGPTRAANRVDGLAKAPSIVDGQTVAGSIQDTPARSRTLSRQGALAGTRNRSRQNVHASVQPGSIVSAPHRPGSIVSAPHRPGSIVNARTKTVNIDDDALERNTVISVSTTIVEDDSQNKENDRQSTNEAYEKGKGDVRALLMGEYLYVCDIPSIHIVFGGGYNTILKLHHAIYTTKIYSKDVHRLNFPIVLVKDSGGAADLLVLAYENCVVDETVKDHRGKEVNNYTIDRKSEKLIKAFLRKAFNFSDLYNFTEITECYRKISDLMVYRDVLLVYDINEGSMDVAMIQALMKDGLDPIEDTQQVEIASKFNKLYLAKDQILGLISNQNIEQNDLESAIKEALIDDRVDFITDILNSSLTVEQILTTPILKNLYAHMNILIDKLSEIGEVIEELIGFGFWNPYANFETSSKEISSVPIIVEDARSVSQLSENIDETQELVQIELTPIENNNQPDDLEDSVSLLSSTYLIAKDLQWPTHDYFLWAVLCNRLAVAAYLLKKVKYPIAAAMIARHLLLKLSEVANEMGETEKSKEMEQKAEEFHNHAIQLLRACYADDKEGTFILLRMDIPEWGNCNLVQLSSTTVNQHFTAEPSYQQILNNLWTDQPTVLQRFKAVESINYDGNNDELAVIISPQESEKEHDSDDESRSSYSTLAFLFLILIKLIKIWNSARAKFFIHTLSDISFLVLFANVLMSTLYTSYMAGTEIVTVIWVSTLVCDEIRQLITMDAESNLLKFKSYISQVINITIIVAFILFYTGLGLRFSTTNFEIARILYCLSFITFALLILRALAVSRSFGPFLVMIGRMTIDLARFLIILSIFMVSYGVISQALLYPNSPWDITLVGKVLYKPYYQMLGEFFLDLVTNGNCPNTTLIGKNEKCVHNAWIMPWLLGFYVLVTNILLLNLLIAVFNDTYVKVQENSDIIWKSQRYTLITEFVKKPALPAPFIIIAHFYRLLKYAWAKYSHRHKEQLDDNTTTIQISRKNINIPKLEAWENWMAFTYWRKFEARDRGKIF
ncbi:Transient receptor potential cation channel subfamily M member 3 [Trichoplax sp. H2]|nr:Transient receptor potential cation channel subfamily M member 3 [Trichoplax sp. H2]|eukprot:RDD41212.1 Transient receptor potential cation channel subfamily M member 3 [Trichoplax sp. H2]